MGDNFAAGMTGGMAFVYDADGLFEARLNPESVLHHRLESPHWEALLRSLVEEHVRETQSKYAEAILADWEREKAKFWQIVPREMVNRLVHPTRLTAVGAAE